MSNILYFGVGIDAGPRTGWSSMDAAPLTPARLRLQLMRRRERRGCSTSLQEVPARAASPARRTGSGDSDEFTGLPRDCASHRRHERRSAIEEVLSSGESLDEVPRGGARLRPIASSTSSRNRATRTRSSPRSPCGRPPAPGPSCASRAPNGTASRSTRSRRSTPRCWTATDGGCGSPSRSSTSPRRWLRSARASRCGPPKAWITRPTTSPRARSCRAAMDAVRPRHPRPRLRLHDPGVGGRVSVPPAAGGVPVAGGRSCPPAEGRCVGIPPNPDWRVRVPHTIVPGERRGPER